MINEKDVFIRAVLYIEKNLFNENLTVLDVANEVKINESLLSEIFLRQDIGVTPKEYICRRRAQEAEKEIIRLYRAGKNIKGSDVAKKCGYSSFNHMTNSLYIVTGMRFKIFKDKVIANYNAGNPPIVQNDFMKKLDFLM